MTSMTWESEWPDLYDLLDKVQDLLDKGNIDEAQKLLDKHEGSFMTCWEYHFIYSRVYSDRNQPRKAVSCLLRGLRAERDNPDCLVGLFYAYAMMGKVKRGGKFLFRAENLYPDNDLVLSALIWYYTETNDLDKAVEYFDRAKAANSNNPETYRNGGFAFDRLGRYEEAEECYRAALLMAPTFEEVRDIYADHLIGGGKVEEAIKLYDEALRDEPKNIRHISKMIYCLSQKSAFGDAEELAKRCIEMYPNSPVGYIDLAYVYLNTDRIEEADEFADKALSVSPIDAEAHRLKAITCSELEHYDEAEAIFEKAAELDPENPDTLRDYYQHLRVVGKHDKMMEIVNKTIKLEHPYCTEDYWFLADFYREGKQNLKAFRYLRLAYGTMPTEKELLPPMIEILLEQGHTNYSLPLFASYVDRSGWTDAMSNFMRNKQFKDRFTQEGIRFLRFTGERPIKYRKYIFNHYLYRFGIIYFAILMAAFTFPAALFFGWRGVGVVAGVSVLAFAVVKIVKLIRFRIAVWKAMRPVPAGA